MLETIGDQITIATNLNLDYRPQELEETGSLRYSIDYTYSKQVLSRLQNGSNIYTEETIRGTFNSPPKSIFFVKSEQIN